MTNPIALLFAMLLALGSFSAPLFAQDDTGDEATRSGETNKPEGGGGKESECD